jgi:adenylosuccinate lyase
MRCERIAGLSRYVVNLVGNAYETASTQWFERTLDDSANRRIVLPHAFLVCDGVLNLAINVASGLQVHHAMIERNLSRELPFLQMEEILMTGVREGGDRQELHERMRRHAREVAKEVREKGDANDLLARLREDPAFAQVPPLLMVRMDPARFTGLASEQVERFLREAVAPVRKRYKNAVRVKAEVRV